MASSGDLASTLQLPRGHLRGTQREKHAGVHVHGLENVTAALPRGALHGLAAEKETGTGMETETILGETVVGTEGGDGPAQDPGQGPGLDLDLEQDHTDEGPALNGRHLESSLLRGRSVEAGDLEPVVGLAVKDGGIMAALATLKMVSLQKVLLIARAQTIPIGLQKRFEEMLMEGTGTSGTAAAHAGKTIVEVVGTEENNEVEGALEGLNVAGAEDVVVATATFTTNRKKCLTAAGSRGTTSQVQATIQGTTHTADSMKTEVAGAGKSLSQASLWLTAQAGPLHPAGLSGGHCLQMFKTITQKGREARARGAGRRKSSSHQLQQVRPLYFVDTPPKNQASLCCLHCRVEK